jgi:hypothetical protein
MSVFYYLSLLLTFKSHDIFCKIRSQNISAAFCCGSFVALKFQAKITKERKSAISAPSSEYEKFK